MSEFVSKYSMRVTADTKQGGRQENQDDFKVMDTPLGCLAILCDGMGGGPGGKTASFVAKNAIAQTVLNSSPQANREDVLRNAIVNAQNALDQKVMDAPSLAGMGSTAVVLLVNEESAVIAHVGDSRCYQLRGKKILTCTRDHSLVGEMVQHKAMTEEEARTSPQSNIITRGLGSMSNHTPDVMTLPYSKGDRFFICSDGIWGIMNKESLLLRLTANTPLENILLGLQQEVDQIGFAAGGHHDNHTGILIETLTDSKLKEKMNKQSIAIISVLSAFLAVSLIFNLVGGKSKSSNAADSELQAQVELLTKQVEELQAYKNRYDKLVNSDDNALEHRVGTLYAQIDSLYKLVEKKNAVIDSLKRKSVVSGTNTNPTTSKTTTTTKPATTTTTTKTTTTAGATTTSSTQATANIDQIVNMFDALLNPQKKNQTEAVKAIQNTYNRLIASLALYGTKNPTSKPTTEAVTRDLNTRREIIEMVTGPDDKGYYTSCGKTTITKLKGKVVENIKNAK